MTNLAASFSADGTTELAHIYAFRTTSSFRDIITGTAGSFHCLTGWDFVTGVGSPHGTTGL
jgi:hypothetical protein